MIVSRIPKTVLVLASILFSQLAPLVAAEPTLAEIESAWRKRQRQAESFRVIWDETRTIAAVGKDGAVVPGQGKAFKLEMDFLAKGEAYRFVADRVSSSDKDPFLRHRTTVVNANRVAKGFTVPESGAGYTQGSIVNIDATMTLIDMGLELTPLLLLFRPLDPRTVFFAEFPKNFELAAGRSVIEGRSCIELREKRKVVSGRLTRVWVDPDCDFAIVRLMRSGEKTITTVISIEKFEETSRGLQPRRWSRKEISEKGVVTDVSEAVVRRFEFDPNIDNSAFDIKFPVGCLVSDYTNAKTSASGRSGGHQAFLQLDNDELSPLSPAELELPYQEILEGRTKGRTGWGWGLWTMLAAGILALVAAAIRRGSHSS